MAFDMTGAAVTILDGALGTMLQKSGRMKPGERPDILSITAPDAVEAVHRQYVEAGSTIIVTNTFGANAKALHGTGYTPDEVIRAAVYAARRATGGAAGIALDIGPLGDFMEPAGSMNYDRAYAMFREQAIAGERYGADLAAIETMSELSELRAAILAVRENTSLPVFATMTFGANGRTYTGCTPEDFASLAKELGVSAAGINCSLSPAEIFMIAERLAAASDLPLIVKPNAGLPDSKTGEYSITPEEFARQMERFKPLNPRFIGGCCGTTPEYIRELARLWRTI